MGCGGAAPGETRSRGLLVTGRPCDRQGAGRRWGAGAQPPGRHGHPFRLLPGTRGVARCPAGGVGLVPAGAAGATVGGWGMMLHSAGSLGSHRRLQGQRGCRLAPREPEGRPRRRAGRGGDGGCRWGPLARGRRRRRRTGCRGAGRPHGNPRTTRSRRRCDGPGARRGVGADAARVARTWCVECRGNGEGGCGERFARRRLRRARFDIRQGGAGTRSADARHVDPDNDESCTTGRAHRWRHDDHDGGPPAGRHRRG
jgi:hypothetical protein